MDVTVDWIAVILATIAAMVIGFVWYGPLFGKAWLKLVGLKEKEASANWQKPMIAMLVLAFVQAYILTHLINFAGSYYGDTSAARGVSTAFWVWLGLVVPTVVGNNMFARRPIQLNYIEAFNALLTLMVMGAIIGGML
jgi:hypothetical protein